MIDPHQRRTMALLSRIQRCIAHIPRRARARRRPDSADHSEGLVEIGDKTVDKIHKKMLIVTLNGAILSAAAVKAAVTSTDNSLYGKMPATHSIKTCR